jgi:hypothetical protein
MHHEPCLYSATIDGNYILFLRQVDDFAITNLTESIATDIINKIDGYLRLKMKNLGILEMFNEVDVVQSKYYIKIHCSTYLSL